MEALEGLLNALKKREYKSFEEANAQLEEVIKLRDAVVAFEKESLLKIVPATFAKTQQFVTSAKNELKKLEADSSAFVKKTLDGLFSNVKTPLTNATNMHFHNRYPEASESLEKARTALVALDVAPYNLAESVKVYVADARTQIDTLEKKISDSMMGRVVDDKVREAKSHGTKAKDMNFHNRNQESLDAIAKARESIALLSEAPYNTHSSVVAFLPDFIKQIDELEAKVGQAMLGRVVDDKIREAKTHGTKAKDMHFHNRYQESLDAVAKARESIEELQSTFGAFKAATDFLPAFIAQIDEIEKKCGESMYGRVVDDKIREAKTHGTKAKDMHFHNRYQESLDAVAKARESIAELSNAPFNTFPAVTAFLPEFIKQIDDYEQKCGEAMMGRVVDEKIREAKTHGTKAKDMHFHNRYQESLDAVTKAREVIADLQSTFSTFKAVVEFLPAYITQIDEIEKKCGEEMYGRIVDEKIREAKTHGTKAKDMHFHNRYQEALDAVAKARESIAELSNAPFNTFPAVTAFLPEFTKNIDEYEKQCGEAMYSRLVDDKIREAKTHGTKAKDMHYHNRYQESLEAVAKARELIAELSNPPYATFKAVVEFLPEFTTNITDIETKCGEEMFGKVVDEKIRAAKTHGTTAKDMHYHNRYQEALEGVAKAREIIAELSATPYCNFKAVIEFLPEFTKQIDGYEKQCSEAMFSRLADDKIREAKTHGTKAKDMHFHNRYDESLEAVAKAREQMSELAQLPYVNLESVKTFLNEFVKQIDDIEQKCGEEMFARVLDDKIRAAKTHGTTAKDMHYHNRYQESLDAVAKARELIAELQEAPWNSLEATKAFLPEFTKQIDDYERQCGEALFSKLVDDKIRAAKTHGTTAKDMHFHSRYQESLDAVAKARESIAELSEAPWNSLEATKAFLPEFIKQVDEYEHQCGEALFSKVVDDKIRAAKTHGTTAKDMHFHSRYQESLDAVAKAREIIAELKEAPYVTLKATQEFLPEFEKQVEQYEHQCGEAMFGRVADDKIRAVKTLVTEAENLHSHSRNEEALQSVAKARDAIAELEEAPFKTLEVTVAYLKDAKPSLDSLEGKIAEVLFGRVVEDKIRAAKTHLTNAKDLHFHSRNSEALTAIAKTRETIAELEETPYNNLPITVAFLKETGPALDDLEAKVGEAMFGRVVYDKVYAGKTHITNAKNFADHSRHQEALDALTKAYESLDELENPPYNTLPLVKTYLTETRAALASLESTITAALGGKAAGASGADEATTPVVKSSGNFNSNFLKEHRSNGTFTEPNAPGFPSGPIQSTIGPWVVHLAGPFTNVQAQSTTPAKTRSFVIQWNTNVLTINGEWKKAVNELIRTAKVAEDVRPLEQYNAPSYIEGKFAHTLSLVEKMEKQVSELPDDEKDTVKKTMLEQLQTAKNYIAENNARETKVAQFVACLSKANSLYHSIHFESERPRRDNILGFVDNIASEWHSINIKFPYLPPFQEKMDKIIKEQEHLGKVVMILEIIEGMVQHVDSKTPIHTQKGIVDGLKQLEKWPVAHRAAIRRLKKVWDSYFRFSRIRWQPEFEPVWPTPSAPTDLWQPSEEDVGIPDYDMIRPGTPAQGGLPFANRKDSTSDPILAEYTLPHAGQIVFSTESIQPQIKNKDALKNKFTLTEPIFARAVWPRAIANYAIGKKKDGTPVYPPEGLMNEAHLRPQLVMSLNLKIDGKPVSPKYTFNDCFEYFTGNDTMYYTQQTVGFGILGLPMDCETFYTGWDLMGRVLYGYLLRAGAGSHKVEMSLHYNLFDQFVTHQNRRDGPTNIDTLTSYPLAEGSFEVEVPAGAKMPDTFGPTKCEPVPLKELQNFYLQRFQENLLWVRLEEDWQIRIEAKEVIEYDKFHDVMVKTKIPAKWGKAYACLGYKNPEKNKIFQQELVALSIIIVVAGPNKTWDEGVETM
jgi:uncharacterized protein (DUF1810 family)